MKYEDYIKTSSTRKPAASNTAAPSSNQYAKYIKKPSENAELDSVEGLLEYARTSGFKKQADKIVEPKKLPFLSRLERGLGALNPAEAILTADEKGSPIQGAKKYVTGLGTGLYEALTGNDMGGERRYFKDIAEKMGVEGGIAKFGLGFMGDVLLDPSTYFGGAILRGATTGTRTTVDVGLKTIGKVAPEAEVGLRMAGEGVKDAVGRAFVTGYKATEGAREDVLTFLSRRNKAEGNLAQDAMQRYGTKAMTPSQAEELAASSIAKRRAEYELGTAVAQKSMDDLKKLFPDVAVSSAQVAQKTLNGLEKATQLKIQEIRKKVDEAVAPIFEARQSQIKAAGQVDDIYLKDTPNLRGYEKVDRLNKTLTALRETASQLRKEKFSAPGSVTMQGVDGVTPILKEEAVEAHNKLIGYEEERLWALIDDLSSKIVKLQSKPAGPVGGAKVAPLKTKELSHAELAIYAEREIKKITNDLATKDALLNSIVESRSIGKKLAQSAVETGDFSKIEEIVKDIDPKLLTTLRAVSDDPVVRKAMARQLERAARFAKNSDIDDPYTFYFPFIKKESLEKFVTQMESSGIRVGSENYRKEFKNLLTDSEIEKDLTKVFFSSEKMQVVDTMSRKFLGTFVSKYGKSLDTFKNSDEALKAGFKVVREKGMFGKEIGYINTYDSMLLSNLITPEFQTLNMLAKASGFDAVTSLFKRSVTGIFLPFHVRNFVSGIVQNFEIVGVQAMNPKMIASGQKFAYNIATGNIQKKGVMKIAGQDVPMHQVYKSFENRFGNDTFYQNDFLQAVGSSKELLTHEKTFSKARLKVAINPKTMLSQEGTIFKLAQTVGQFVEHQQKATAYLIGISQGKTIPESLTLAERAGFDYRSLTAFESQVMRRIFPFYSFTRKNIELQMKTFNEHPERIAQILSFFRNTGDRPSQEESESLPAYIQEHLGIKLSDTPDGLKQYISNFGTPIDAFASLINDNPVLTAISMTNPVFIKTPIELGFQKDSFRRKDLKDVYDAREYSSAPKLVKDLLDIKEVTKPVFAKDARGKLKKIGERKQYVADPTKLLIARSLFTSRGVSYLDEVFGGDLQGFAKFVKLTSGMKPVQLDVEMGKSIKERDQKRALEDLLIKMGTAARFQNVYIPKDK